MSIVKRTENLCKEHSLTITGLERELGFSKGSICRWDINTPAASKVCAVAEKFNVTTDYLLGLTEERNKPIPEDELDREILERMSKLSPAEQEKVAIFIEGMIASRK